MDSGQRGMAAMNPMLLQHTLRGLCGHGSQWVYAVFWRILPRNYPPPQWETEGGLMDRSKGNRRNWILVWEDGFCNFEACASGKVCNNRGLCAPSFVPFRQDPRHSSSKDQQFEAMSPELFFKMSHEVYNYGEGLMGKVAADNSHKWVQHEPLENEMGFFSPWHGSTEPHPRTWEAQFKSGIQTIAVIAVQEGVLQLGSTHKIVEDLNFVLFMQRKFNFLRCVPGVFVPHPASSSGVGHASKSKLGKEPTSSESSPVVPNSQLKVTTPNDHALLPGVEWPTPIVTAVAVNKRLPPESSEPSLNSNNWYSYLNGGHGFDQICTHAEGCLPPPNLAPQYALIPSMSSLQALLSKLPSVTVPEHNYVNNGCSFPGSSSDHGNFEITNSLNGLDDFNNIQLPAMESSDGSDLHRMIEGEYNITSPADYTGSVSEDVEFPSGNFRMGAKEKHARYGAMFDSYGTLTEFGIQEASQENGDSFLNEICS